MYKSGSEYFIKQLDESYLEQVVTIENESFITPWPRSIIESEIKNDKTFCRVSLDDNHIVNGYCISLLLFDELHILKIAVQKDYRRKGIANELINDVVDFYKDKGAKYVILEVRVSNEGAIKLYKKLGFEVVRVRKNYYRTTGEDAYVMLLDLEKYYQNVLSTI